MNRGILLSEDEATKMLVYFKSIAAMLESVVGEPVAQISVEPAFAPTTTLPTYKSKSKSKKLSQAMRKMWASRRRKASWTDERKAKQAEIMRARHLARAAHPAVNGHVA